MDNQETQDIERRQKKTKNKTTTTN